MSDEHEHEHSHEFPYYVMNIGPSQDEIEHRHLNAMSNGHDMRDYFETLDQRGLEKMIVMIQTVQSAPESSGWYYIGILAEMLDKKFGKCKTCGQNHDEILAEMAGDGGSTVAEPVNTKGFPSKGSTLYNEYMIEYNMEQDDDGSDRVMCKGCQMWYLNLEDRMMKPPGVAGCSGCKEKAKWG